jgi:hypothetical protein
MTWNPNGVSTTLLIWPTLRAKAASANSLTTSSRFTLPVLPRRSIAAGSSENLFTSSVNSSGSRLAMTATSSARFFASSRVRVTPCLAFFTPL